VVGWRVWVNDKREHFAVFALWFGGGVGVGVSR
jgi:hypothetical protein